MRTTVTIDADVERLLRQTIHRTQKSFKETLNAAIRTGLRRGDKSAAPTPFIVRGPWLGELKPGIDAASLNQLVDELEIEAFSRKNQRQ